MLNNIEFRIKYFRFSSSLSPAYDLLNSRIHINDKDFALEEGLLPKENAQGKVLEQFYKPAEIAAISEKQVNKVFNNLLSNQDKVPRIN